MTKTDQFPSSTLPSLSVVQVREDGRVVRTPNTGYKVRIPTHLLKTKLIANSSKILVFEITKFLTGRHFRLEVGSARFVIFLIQD